MDLRHEATGRHTVNQQPHLVERALSSPPNPLAPRWSVERRRFSNRERHVYPGLTITDMYNVLEKLGAGEPLTTKDKGVHAQGLVSVLRQIHDDLNSTVFAAYGWPAELSDEQILERLVALNAERVAEEQRGLIRWLRPQFQNKAGHATQGVLDLPNIPAAATKKGRDKATKQPWPTTMAEQAKALRTFLAATPNGGTAEEIAQSFRRANVDRVSELLETLASLGQARKMDGGRFSA